ncbi:MAG: NfeD family protein [Tepidisphaeraceae bacterium]|jgi:membrane-bound ClpP family serine protease
MTLAGWIILLIVAGAVLLVAELMLPSHGVFGALAVLCVLGSVGICFRVNPWAALWLFLVMVGATPFVWSAAVRIWPRTPLGRRMVLQPVENARQPLPFQIGQIGVALSELKPMGECDFGGRRVEVRCESGFVAAGARVVVVSADGRRATVREATGAATV